MQRPALLPVYSWAADHLNIDVAERSAVKDPPLSAPGLGGVPIIHLDKYIRTDKIMAVFQAALLHSGCELAVLIDGRRCPATTLGSWVYFLPPQILIH